MPGPKPKPFRAKPDPDDIVRTSLRSAGRFARAIRFHRFLPGKSTRRPLKLPGPNRSSSARSRIRLISLGLFCEWPAASPGQFDSPASLRAKQPAPSPQLPAPSSQLRAPGAQPPAPSSQLPAPSSQLPAPSWQLSAPGSQLPAPSSQRPGPSPQPLSLC